MSLGQGVGRWGGGGGGGGDVLPSAKRPDREAFLMVSMA